MADSMDLDLSEFKSLSVSLGHATVALVAAEHAVVVKTLTNIKQATRKAISNHPTWRKLAPTVSYDAKIGELDLGGEVGYEDRGQGELAGIAEFGSARHAPHPALMPAARDEAPRFEKASLDAVAKAIGGAL